jgi:hypothetical protein
LRQAFYCAPSYIVGATCGRLGRAGLRAADCLPLYLCIIELRLSQWYLAIFSLAISGLIVAIVT